MRHMRVGEETIPVTRYELWLSAFAGDMESIFFARLSIAGLRFVC